MRATTSQYLVAADVDKEIAIETRTNRHPAAENEGAFLYAGRRAPEKDPNCSEWCYRTALVDDLISIVRTKPFDLILARAKNEKWQRPAGSRSSVGV